MFLDDAEQQTESWQLRHSEAARRTLGVWRWRGMVANMDTILRLCVGNRVIDFGGADGPLGLGSVVVDEKADCKTLDDVPGMVDVIFSSHTLEHIGDLNVVLAAFAAKIVHCGHLILHVPAWTCERWRAGVYESNRQTPHLHTFCMEGDGCELDCEPIDRLVGRHFRLVQTGHCGDNSLFIIGVKRD